MSYNAGATMANEAILWQKEFIEDYNQMQAILPMYCDQSAWLQGSRQCVFSIAPSDLQATTRSRNGQINYDNVSLRTVTVDLTESIGAQRVDDFTAFRSAPDLRRVMYREVAGAIARAIDDKIFAQLDQATNVFNSGTAITPDLATFSSLIRVFRTNTFGGKGDVTCVMSDAALLGLENIPQVSSSDYAEIKLPGGNRAFRWRGINWVAHERVPGRGTTAAKCFLFAKSAVGYKSAREPQMRAGEDDKHLDYYCNGRVWDASRILLQRGVLEFTYNDQAAYSNHNLVVVQN